MKKLIKDPRKTVGFIFVLRNSIMKIISITLYSSLNTHNRYIM